MSLSFTKRTWIRIDLDLLKENYRTACSLTAQKVTCVLKSNAYGHGAVRTAQALAEAGCASFAVSCAREALELRAHGIAGEILVMGLTEQGYLPACLAEHITLTAADEEGIRQAEEAAAALGTEARLQIKLDTGFHRLGFPCTHEAAQSIASAMKAAPHCVLDGVFSHLGLVNRELDEQQHDAFDEMLSHLRACGITVPDAHICDSIGLVRYPEWHYTRVRVGAFLYGVRPSRSQHMPFACRETLTFKTTIAQIREVEAGAIVGYGDDMPMQRRSRVATICAGYGDGYPRSLSYGKGQVLVRGRLCPVVGLICMDQAMIDVTDVADAEPGDEVTLLGGGIDYMTYADWCHTNRNECITILSNRPLRVYEENGQIVTVLDGLMGERRDL